jgi:hypothetical protein
MSILLEKNGYFIYGDWKAVGFVNKPGNSVLLGIEQLKTQVQNGTDLHAAEMM